MVRNKVKTYMDDSNGAHKLTRLCVMRHEPEDIETFSLCDDLIVSFYLKLYNIPKGFPNVCGLVCSG